jgi:hypothetical protein
MFPRSARPILIALAAILASWTGSAGADRPFRIEVVDEATGRGVPLIELRTVNDILLVTDSAGVSAFDEPGLMNQSVFFSVRGHGYEFAKDGFGFAGKALPVTPGGSARLTIRRLNIAERLYRVTGGGIYRDSVLTGREPPIRQPLLNTRVFGSDSVLTALYRGRVHWFWGDTNRPSYPLGNFHVPGATSRLPADGGLDPAVGVDLDYFADAQGFARETAKMPGDGPTWLEGLTVLHDTARGERLFAAYMKVKPPLTIHERGLAEFDDATSSFRKVSTFAVDAPAAPGGHPLTLGVGRDARIWFARPYPLVRVAATPETFCRLDDYEAYTCLRPGSRLERPEIDRNPEGRVVYAWKKNTPAVGPAEQSRLIADGQLKSHEGLLQLRDHETGRAVTAHAGTVHWNAHRKRFVMITVETGGESSFLGEVWYAEADSPLGPWVYAVKVVTHERYSFYNPRHHPMFDAEGGRRLYFEGTYTHTFSGNPVATPRYDYNQVMYRLDLDDARLTLPVAVYRPAGDQALPPAPRANGSAEQAEALPDFDQIAFFACDRPAKGTVPVYDDSTNADAPRLTLTRPKNLPAAVPLFHVLPADVPTPPQTTVELYEYRSPKGDARWYSTEETAGRDGFHRQDKPLCRVWKNPYLAPRNR